MPSLDVAKVEELRRLDQDGRLMARLRDAFERTADRQRAELLAAAAAQQGAAVQRAAHTLQAAASQLGAAELAEHCAMLERAARHGDLPPHPQALRDLDRLLQQTRADLAQLCP